jgi:hypothetical protein
MLQYRPLKFFWIAEFSDGTATAQFDPDTGEEVQGHPDWLPSKTDKNDMIVKDGENVPYREAHRIPQHFRGKRVVRIGWYPFSSELAKKILAASEKLVIPSKNKPVVIELKDGEEAVCYRSHEIKLQMRSGGVEYAETVYVLGIKGKKIFHMNEDGRILN